MKTLEELRKESGLKACYICKVLGVSRPTLRGWETGKVAIKNNNLKILCELYGVKPKDVSIMKIFNGVLYKRIGDLNAIYGSHEGQA